MPPPSLAERDIQDQCEVLCALWEQPVDMVYGICCGMEVECILISQDLLLGQVPLESCSVSHACAGNFGNFSHTFLPPSIIYLPPLGFSIYLGLLLQDIWLLVGSRLAVDYAGSPR